MVAPEVVVPARRRVRASSVLLDSGAGAIRKDAVDTLEVLGACISHKYSLWIVCFSVAVHSFRPELARRNQGLARLARFALRSGEKVPHSW